MNKVKLALIGSEGYWANNIKKSLNLEYFELIATCDKVIQKEKIAPHYYEIETLIKEIQIDAAIIATPAYTHYSIVKLLLNNGVHCFCEKPLTLDSEEAFELNRIAIEKGLILQVDLTWLYDEHIQKIKTLLNTKIFGSVKECYISRINLTSIPNIDIISDLSPHDFSILFFLFGFPLSVSTKAEKIFNINNYDYVTMNMCYINNFCVNIELSWCSDKKSRQLKIITSKGQIITDFDGTIKCLEGKKEHKIQIFQLISPLRLALNDFYYCIQNQDIPLSNGSLGYNCVFAAERALKSIDTCVPQKIQFKKSCTNQYENVNNLDGEIWKEIKGYEGKYAVSNMGRVKSFVYSSEGRFLSNKYSRGYNLVVFVTGSVRKSIKIARLVAEAFIPNPENKKIVNHKNGIKSDDRLENLEWATHSENTQHAHDMGLIRRVIGKNHPNYGKFGGHSSTAISIYQIDPISLKIVNEFSSIIEAKASLKRSGEQIHKALKNKIIAYDFLWIKKNEYEQINLKQLVTSLRVYRFVSPEGKLIEIINLFKFCRENKLPYYKMEHIFKDKILEYNGWKKHKEE